MSGIPTNGEVTGLLREWSDGDEAALERLLPLVEAELRRLARAYMARRCWRTRRQQRAFSQRPWERWQAMR